jgi:hypothetical protein
MKFLNIVGSLILPLMISCSENKNTATTTTQSQQQELPENPAANSKTPIQDTTQPGSENVKIQSADSLMRVIISFYSIGQGIDRGQTEKLLAYLQSYEKNSGKKIEYSEVHWGREGETDYCFPLSGYSDKQVSDFIDGAKESLNAAEHVHFLQNQACRKGR